MAAEYLLSVVNEEDDTIPVKRHGQEIRSSRALWIYRKFNITQKLETARGIPPDIYTVWMHVRGSF